MIPQGQISRIPAAQIDFDDLTFRLSPLPPDTEDDLLAASLQRAGLLHPPLLRPWRNGYQLVNGHRRAYLAARKLRLPVLACLVLPTETDEIEALALALEALVCKRPPTAMELARFCHKMQALLADQEIARRFLPLLGLDPNPFRVAHCAALAALEEPFAIALHQGRLQESVARELLALTVPERLTLFELIEILQLSASNQKKVTAACRELSRRERISLLAIMGSAEIGAILDHPEMNTPQKTAALMRHLHERCFPRLSAATAEFNAFRNSLGLPPTWSITPSPSFEDDRVTLSIMLENRELLRQNLPALLAATGQQNWAEEKKSPADP